jgi:hypothetical protein
MTGFLRAGSELLQAEMLCSTAVSSGDDDMVLRVNPLTSNVFIYNSSTFILLQLVVDVSEAQLCLGTMLGSLTERSHRLPSEFRGSRERGYEHTSCSLVDRCQHCRRKCCLLQDHSSNLKKETTRLYETLVMIYQIIRHHNPEDSNLLCSKLYVYMICISYTGVDGDNTRIKMALREIGWRGTGLIWFRMRTSSGLS